MDGISVVKTGVRCETFIPVPLLFFHQPPLFVECDWGGTDGYFYIRVNGFHRCGMFLGFRDVGFDSRVFVKIVR